LLTPRKTIGSFFGGALDETGVICAPPSTSKPSKPVEEEERPQVVRHKPKASIKLD